MRRLLLLTLLLIAAAGCRRLDPVRQPVSPARMHDVPAAELALAVDRELDRIMEQDPQVELAKRSLVQEIRSLLAQPQYHGLASLWIYREQTYPEQFDFYAEVAMERSHLEPTPGATDFRPVFLLRWNPATLRWGAYHPHPDHGPELLYP